MTFYDTFLAQLNNSAIATFSNYKPVAIDNPIPAPIPPTPIPSYFSSSRIGFWGFIVNRLQNK